MRFRAFLTALAIGASLPLFAASAPAQEKDAVVEMARRRFAEGVKYFDQKRYEEARAAFMQAYALKRHPALLLNLGLSEVRSGHPLEAARHFTAFLKESPNASASERSEAEKGLAAARTKLGRIQITVNVAGAEVLVDGESVGQSPLAEPVDALPGTRSVAAKFAGRMAQADVSVAVGKTSTSALSLEGSTAPAVAVAAPPPASGDTTGEAATSASAAGEPPKEAPPSADVSTHSTSSREPFFYWLTHSGAGLAGLGVTVIGLGVGVGFTIAGQSASNNVDKVTAAILDHAANVGMDPNVVPCNPAASGFESACAVLEDNKNKQDTDRTVATIGYVAGGVGAVATVITYFATAKKTNAHEARMTILPYGSPTGAGVSLAGAF